MMIRKDKVVEWSYLRYVSTKYLLLARGNSVIAILVLELDNSGIEFNQIPRRLVRVN